MVTDRNDKFPYPFIYFNWWNPTLSCTWSLKKVPLSGVPTGSFSCLPLSMYLYLSPFGPLSMYLSLPPFVSKKGRKIAVADPGPPLFLDQTNWGPKGRKNYFGSPPFPPPPPPYLRVRMTPPSPLYLKVWIRVFVWTDPGWFIYQLEARIWFWSSAAWLQPSCTWN